MLQRYLGILGATVAVIAIAVGIGFARQSAQLRRQVDELKKNPQQGVNDEAKKLVEEVRGIVDLPEGEGPTVATITDRERLKDVPFFTRAENGDKVLIYVTARRAYLYRPGTRKLVEVATINLSPRVAAVQDIEGKIALLNATDVAGLTVRIEETLKRLLPKLAVVSRGNAKANLETSILVDLTGTRSEDAERFATAFGVDVGTFPEGETRPEGADFVILLGQDVATRPSPSPSSSPSPEASPSPTPSPSPAP